MHLYLKLLFFLLLAQPFFTFSQTILPLNINWKFHQLGKTEWYPASVPGSIHSDLLTNKLIEDPFFGQNETSLKWIENEDWEYKTTFTIDEKILKNEHLDLVFDGLDTYTSIYLNNKPLLRTDNMFRKWSIDCKKLLKKGENEILIQFYSPVKIAQNKAKKLPYTLPGEEKPFVRKAAFQFGWDFAPRLVTSGIWKQVYLYSWNSIVLNEIQLIQKKLDKNSALISAIFEIITSKPGKVDLTINNHENKTTLTKKTVTLKKGSNFFTIDFHIENPKLWWTNGLGEAYLYNLTCNIISQKKLLASKNVSLGLRTIELIQEKDTIGTSFYFKLNGVPVFMKGSNYIPQNIFPSIADSSTHTRLIADAVTCNMNMLRVWGGGIYQDDTFYELCDKNGILVWQDFMFACTMYPGDSAFLENVKQEITYQVTRLRNHPCIALWCGNNEVDEGWKNWGWQKELKYSSEDSAIISNNYTKLFHTIIPDLVKKHDAQRAYWPSSPKIGWGHVESLHEGDSHYWGVWWGKEPFETYKNKIGRFVSEYGIQGFPIVQTINKIVPADEQDINSLSMLSHQKCNDGYQTIQTYIDQEYKPAKDFNKFIYLSGLSQAYGIKTAIESHRRFKPNCMGTLYWQFNDCWPGISWSGIDYFGHWKPLQYFVKTAFAKIIISIIEEKEEVKVFIISDKQQKQIGSLQLRVIDLTGKEYWKQNFIAEVPSNSSKLTYKIKTDDLFADRHRQKMIFIAELKEKDSLIVKSVFYFSKAKDLKLSKPEISYEVFEENSCFKVLFKSGNLVRNICLSIEGDATFSNNYFDILPNETTEIICKTNLTIDEFKDKLQFFSLYDSYISK